MDSARRAARPAPTATIVRGRIVSAGLNGTRDGGVVVMGPSTLPISVAPNNGLAAKVAANGSLQIAGRIPLAAWAKRSLQKPLVTPCPHVNIPTRHGAW